MKFKVLVVSYWLLVISSPLFSQQKNLPLNREFGLSLDYFNINGDKNHVILSDKLDELDAAGMKTRLSYMEHSGFKPLKESYLKTEDYIFSNKNDFKKIENYKISPLPESGIKRKLAHESLIIIRDTAAKFFLTLDPLFNFEFGTDLEDNSNEKLYKNSRGLLVSGDIGNTFSFESSFYENQATFVKYIDAFNDTFKVVPGQGRWKNFKTNGYDYAMASGYVSYSPNKHFNLQAGHGKHFVGDGYRSLLLSDNAFNYPYARITSTVGKIQYTNLYAVLMNLTPGEVTTPPNTEPLFQKKAAGFHLLSWNVHKRIQLGLFQGMIWQAADNENKQDLNFHYFNPVIFSSAARYSTNNTNNILLGSTLKIKLSSTVAFYGQYALDDMGGKGSIRNKTGFQIGIKAFDIFKIKNLHFQAEYNQVNPYTYAHKKTEQNYSHYNQPLAHPLGANFRESVTFINYRIGDFFTELKFNYAIIGADSTGKNYGNNIFRSDNNAYYGISSGSNELGQGISKNLMYTDFKTGYLINPSTNLNIVLGITNRIENTSAQKNATNFVYVGVRTSLTNVYYDF